MKQKFSFFSLKLSLSIATTTYALKSFLLFLNFSFLTAKFLQVHSIFIYRLLLVIATNCMTFLCHLAGLVCIIDLRAVCVFAGLAINLYLCAVATVLRCLIVFSFSLSVCWLLPCCLLHSAGALDSKWTH